MDFMQIDALYFYLTNYNWYLSLNLRWLCYSFILVDLAVNLWKRRALLAQRFMCMYVIQYGCR
jgi:hypothetical protein